MENDSKTTAIRSPDYPAREKKLFVSSIVKQYGDTCAGDYGLYGLRF